MSAFAEQWGRPLEGAGYTQLSNLLLRRWREIGVSRTERDLLIGIISYQSNHETIPSLKQVAYEAGQCYETARKNLKHLTAYKKDGGLGLLIPVLLTHGRTRYNMMPLRRELEKLKAQPLEIVKPARPRPVPKPEPKPEPLPAAALPEDEFWDQAAESPEVEEPELDAERDWQRIKDKLASYPGISRQALINFLGNSEGLRWQDDILVVAVNGGMLYRINATFHEPAEFYAKMDLGAAGIMFVERKPKRKKRVGILPLVAAAVGV